MPVTTTFVDNSGDIHQGPGYLFWNILRPLFGLRPIIGAGAPPTISDPASPSAWASATAYAVGALAIDTNNNVIQVKAVAGTGTSAGSAPTFSTIIGGTTVDNPGANQITWTNCGPSWIWAASKAVVYDQQLRDANGNIQQCIVPGTTGTPSAPTWGTNPGDITQDNTAYWMCLGATIAVGANNGALTFKIQPKMESIMSDHDTAPVDFFTTAEDGEIDGTLMELSMSKVAAMLPNGAYTAGTDTNFPTGAQAYHQVTFGGQTRVPRPCVAVVSYRRQYGNSTSLSTNPFRYYGGVVYAAGPAADGTFGFSLKKNTEYKVSAKGSVVGWRPVGDRIAQMFKQV